MSSDGKFRRKKVNFSQVSNIALRDSNLSLKTKGLYSLIQSYITLENFVLHKSYLMSLCKEGEKSFDSSWNELKNNGYLKIFRIRNRAEEGRGLFSYEYDLLDIPNLEQQAVINIKINGETSDKTERKEDVLYHPCFGGGTKRTQYKMDSVQNGGYINNTDINNTDINNNDNNKSKKTVVVVVGEENNKNKFKKEIANNNIELIRKIMGQATNLGIIVDEALASLMLKESNGDTNGINNALRLAKQQEKNIKNLKGFLIKAIKEGWQSEPETLSTKGKNKINSTWNIKSKTDLEELYEL